MYARDQMGYIAELKMTASSFETVRLAGRRESGPGSRFRLVPRREERVWLLDMGKRGELRCGANDSRARTGREEKLRDSSQTRRRCGTAKVAIMGSIRVK